MDLVHQSIKILEERNRTELLKVKRFQAQVNQNQMMVAGPDDLSDLDYQVKGDKESPDNSHILQNSIVISRKSYKEAKQEKMAQNGDNLGPAAADLIRSSYSINPKRVGRKSRCCA